MKHASPLVRNPAFGVCCLSLWACSSAEQSAAMMPGDSSVMGGSVSSGGGGSVISDSAGGTQGSVTPPPVGSGGMTVAAPPTGASGAPGAAGNAAMPPISNCAPWPPATSTEEVDATIDVFGTFDGGLTRYVGTGDLGSGGQAEGQPPFFSLSEGAVLRNVILGGPSADGIHCDGSCRLENVWFEDVGEDAATLEGNSASQTMTVECGGARSAADKVFQHNGPGTIIISNFMVEDFGRLYRSCGNCGDQFQRNVELNTVVARDGDGLVGLNENYGDIARFEAISIEGDITICERYQGNDTGAEPEQTGSGPDAEHCLYQTSDIEQL